MWCGWIGVFLWDMRIICPWDEVVGWKQFGYAIGSEFCRFVFYRHHGYIQQQTSTNICVRFHDHKWTLGDYHLARSNHVLVVLCHSFPAMIVATLNSCALFVLDQVVECLRPTPDKNQEKTTSWLNRQVVCNYTDRPRACNWHAWASRIRSPARPGPLDQVVRTSCGDQSSQGQKTSQGVRLFAHPGSSSQGFSAAQKEVDLSCCLVPFGSTWLNYESEEGFLRARWDFRWR